MPMNLVTFDAIPIEAPIEEIYKRLGYQNDVTEVTNLQREQTDRAIEEAISFISLKGTAKRAPIEEKTPSGITFSGGIRLESRGLAKFLEDSGELLLMAATAGAKIYSEIKKHSPGKDVTRAVVFDAVASEMANASLDWIMEYFNRELRRENKYLTQKRYSAGYGDFHLKNQKVMYDILRLGRLGVTINESFVLLPEKSVTAVCGVCG
jgi:hypothetical protein